MRMFFWLAVVAIFVLVAVAVLIAKRSAEPEMRGSKATVHVVLIGASIGQAWNLAEWPVRAKVSGLTAESIPAWQFDKTEAVGEVLMRPARKFQPTRTYLKSLFQPPPPRANIVILKECSSYFPGDLLEYERSIQSWISQLQSKHIMVILATVVPVSKTRAQQSAGKQENLVQYNEWVRQYAQQRRLPVLDLEAALRTDDAGRYLQDKFATSDGSHLNIAAYNVLDDVLKRTLCGTGIPAVQDLSVATAH